MDSGTRKSGAPTLRGVKGLGERRGFSLRQQLLSVMPLFTLWFAGVALLLVARFQNATSLSSLVLDASYVAGQPWYTGAISNLGILVWTSGIAFAGAGAWVAHRIGRSSAARFLAFGALATLVLVLDDAFRLHTGPLEALVGSKTAAQALVILPVLVWVVTSHRDISRTRSFLLFAALGSLAGSVLVDMVYAPGGDGELLIEDGMKFLGILAWSQYFAITARDIAASAIDTGIRRGSQFLDDHAATDETYPELRRAG